MRKLIAISLFICISNFSYAQFGKTQNEVRTRFEHPNYKITTCYSPNGDSYLKVIDEKREIRFYFNGYNKVYKVAVKYLDNATFKEFWDTLNLEYTELRVNKWYKKSEKKYITIERAYIEKESFFIKRLETKSLM